MPFRLFGLFEEIRNGNFRQARLILFCFVLMFFGLTIFQFRSVDEFKDYEPAPAYIDNVSSDKKVNNKGVRTEYTYDVHWTYDGQEHVKTIKHSIDKPDLDLIEVRVDPDTGKMTLGSSEGSRKGALFSFLVAGISFVIWLILLIISRNRREEVRENCSAFILIGIIGLPVALLVAYATGTDSRYASSFPYSLVFIGICGVAIVAGILMKAVLKEK